MSFNYTLRRHFHKATKKRGSSFPTYFSLSNYRIVFNPVTQKQWQYLFNNNNKKQKPVSLKGLELLMKSEWEKRGRRALMLNFTEIFWTTWSEAGSPHVIDLIRTVGGRKEDFGAMET